MREIYIPETVEAYEADTTERLFPDERVVDHDFYRGLGRWVLAERTPLLYTPTHPEERGNLSINFNWLAERDYSDTTLGEPEAVATLYGLHEATHMTHRLPTRLSEVTAAEYAEDFTYSEYRASNESEIQVYYRIPELRELVFRGTTLAVDIMKQRGIPLQPMSLLNNERALLIEHSVFDRLVGDDPAAQEQLARIKRFNGNRTWAEAHYYAIRDRFDGYEWPQSHGLTDIEYENLAEYDQPFTQEQYEANIIRNVRFGFAMCNLQVPFITTFNQALEAAKDLENHHALI
jgi:hypothetical protein